MLGPYIDGAPHLCQMLGEGRAMRSQQDSPVPLPVEPGPISEVLSTRPQLDRGERPGVREGLSVEVKNRLRPEGRLGVGPGEEGELSLPGLAHGKALRQGGAWGSETKRPVWLHPA